ncbi:MAG TPA: HEAT repeat domain-containing protein [Candidatus Polarisedimenticolaceae bacterium]
MTLPPRANEIPELVRRLGSRSASRVDDARARLALFGSRAVPALIEALDGDNPRTRANAMPLLALTQDPRGREALTGMLVDRDPRLREVALRSIARFPSPEAVAALERALTRERSSELRVVALQGLLELCEAGQDGALRPVLALLVDSGADGKLRLVAVELIPLLKGAERRALVRRLRLDASPEVSRRAADVEEALLAPRRTRRVPPVRLVSRLASPSYTVWYESVRQLARCGASAIVPLVEAMRRHAHDPEFCARAGLALRALAPRHVRALAFALEHVDEPLPLLVLLEVAGSSGEKSLVYRIRDVIERLRARNGANADGFDPMVRVRAKAHLELARVGSRCAVQDLREMLSAGDIRLEPEAIEAVELIGKRDELPELLRAWSREDRYIRERIGTTVRAIMRRERIRRTSRLFRALGPEQRRALEAVLPPARPRPARARFGR